MSDTDQVLRGAVKHWLTELPAAERDSLIAEVINTPTNHTVCHERPQHQ